MKIDWDSSTNWKIIHSIIKYSDHYMHVMFKFLLNIPQFWSEIRENTTNFIVDYINVYNILTCVKRYKIHQRTVHWIIAICKIIIFLDQSAWVTAKTCNEQTIKHGIINTYYDKLNFQNNGWSCFEQKIWKRILNLIHNF